MNKKILYFHKNRFKLRQKIVIGKQIFSKFDYIKKSKKYSDIESGLKIEKL